MEGERSQIQGDDDRVDAFVFANDVEEPRSFREVVDGLRDTYGEMGDGPVVFLSEFLGEFRICIHLTGPTLGDIQDFIGKDLWEAGIRSDHAVEKKPTLSPMGPIRRSPKPPGLALIRIDLAPGAEPTAVYEAIAELGDPRELEVYASSVYGTFDMLVEIGGDGTKLQDLIEVAQRVNSIDGVARSASAIAWVKA